MSNRRKRPGLVQVPGLMLGKSEASSRKVRKDIAKLANKQFK